MVKDFDEEIAKVYLDAELQAREGPTIEIVVVLKRDFPGALVNLDQIGLRRIAVTVCGAMNEYP